MTFSIQIHHLLLFITFFFFLLFPLLNASDSKPCYTSSCRQGNYINIRFPFWLLHKQPESCGHTKFKLLCNDHQETTLNLPTSKPFLVQEIDYQLQRIRLKDPENCLARRLLSFNSSSWSPFKPLQLLDYTFFTCPNNKTIINSSLHKPIHCLGNSTSSFFATPLHLGSSIPSSCEVLKKVLLPVSDPIGFGGDLNGQSLWLKWDSPDCSLCETKTNSRCGFVNNTNNFQVQCFSSVNNGLHNTSLQVLKIICLSLVGPLMALTFCVGLVMCSSERVSSQIQNAVVARLSGSVTPQPNEEVIVITTTGLDESTIESYKKVELGESKRLPTGSNDTLCSICLSEYESKETIRCLPECDHCFHSECIDAWLKLHSSCPVCRNNPSPSRA